jgi:hypothetical protein
VSDQPASLPDGDAELGSVGPASFPSRSSAPGSVSKSKPLTIDLTSDGPDEMDQETDEVPEGLIMYRKMLTAVLLVVSFCLCSRDGFTPLSTKTLVSPYSLPATLEFKSESERKGEEEILPSFPVTAPEIVAPLILELEIFITSLGTLIIIPHSEKQPAIRRISTYRINLTHLMRREVFLAPWGEWGRLLPPDEKFDPNQNKADDKWKEHVLSYLKDRGVISTTPLAGPSKSVLQETIEKGKWLYVEIWVRSLMNPSMGDLHRILWPESLIFLQAEEGDKRLALPMKNKGDVSFWRQLFDDPEYYQLAWGKLSLLLATQDREDGTGENAEYDLGSEWWDVESAVKWGQEWLKGREERAQKINENTEVRKKRDLAESWDDKEMPKVVDKGKGRMGQDNKTSGGVYPTPPDVAVVAASLASTSSIGAAEMSSVFPAGMGSVVETHWAGTRGASGSISHPNIGPEAELFGEEMDDMDTLMKVTDDDFDFFDGPGFENKTDDKRVVGGMDIDEDADPMDIQDVQTIDMEPGMTDVQMEIPLILTETPSNVATHLLQPPTANSSEDKQQPTETMPTDAPDIPTETENQVRTPPLSPHRAIKLLVPGYSTALVNGASFTPPASGKTPSAASTVIGPTPTGLSKRRTSMYSPIMFTETVELADRKYAPGGRFFIPERTENEECKGEDATKPNQSLGLKRKRKGVPSRLTVFPTTQKPGGAEVDDTAQSGNEWEDSSEESDADDMTETDESKYHTSPDRASVQQLGFLNWTGRKRKWLKDDSDIDIDSPSVSQQHDVSIGADSEVEVMPEIMPEPWKNMQPDEMQESLVGIFEDLRLRNQALTIATLGETEFNNVAITLSHQVAGWMHTSWSRNHESIGEDGDDSGTILIQRRCGQDRAIVEDTVKSLFKEAAVVRCNLETYAAIADSIPEPPPLPPPPPLGHFSRNTQTLKPNVSQRRNKDGGDSIAKRWDIFHIPPPHVVVQRGDNILEMLPPALHFWETFSLAPISGGKNVISCCIHPASGALEEGADFLLDRISSSYEAGRFGVHVRAQIDGVVKNGLVPVNIPKDSPRSYEIGTKAILSRIESFGSVLAHGVADEGMNIVVYVINPFEHPSALVDICTAFVRMQIVYEASISTIPHAKPNHLALQIVPSKFVAHKLGCVLRIGIVHRLAVEVYSRCIQTDTDISYADAQCAPAPAPAIQLAKSIPKNIEFRLTPDPSPALLKENQLLHVAYSQSIDERWVAVAWSDNTGSLQKTAVVNLGRRNTNILKPFSDIMKEIWDITTDLIKYPAVKWRLCFTKIGPMPEDEVTAWRAMVRTHDRITAAYLISADISTPYRLTELLPELKMENFSTQANINTSPAANTPTPGPPSSVLSPDTTASTPGASDSNTELDSDAELVDVSDDSWGVILAHSLPRTNDLADGTRGRVSGLLLRRSGGEDGGGWKVVVRMSVLDGGGKDLVKEIIEIWRGLGIIGTFQGGRPGIPWMLGWCHDVLKIGRVL